MLSFFRANSSCGPVICHNKNGPNRFSHLDILWIQTNRHPNKQIRYILGFQKLRASFIGEKADKQTGKEYI